MNKPAPSGDFEGVHRDAFTLGTLSIKDPIKHPDGSTTYTLPEATRDIKVPPLNPVRIEQIVTFHDEASFVDYVNKFQGVTTMIFAEPAFVRGDNQSRILAAIDYHGPENPQSIKHKVLFAPRASEQWIRWNAANGRVFTQPEFAEFIEEVRRDIHDPNAATLLDIVRAFKANKSVEFDSLTYQPDSSVLLNYSEKVNQTGRSGPLPQVMTLGIPVFFRGAPFQVPVFVRFRLTGGSVKFELKLDRPDVILDTAFGEIVDRIAEATGVTALLGTFN